MEEGGVLSAAPRGQGGVLFSVRTGIHGTEARSCRLGQLAAGSGLFLLVEAAN